MYFIFEDKLWMGTEASLHNMLSIVEAQTKMMAAGQAVVSSQRQETRVPRLVEVHDGVAHINISGSLVNSGDEDWNEYFGLTGYPEIREAMVYAATNPDVKHILLNIESGGGQVSGVSDTGKLIRMINDRVKPVTAFTDGAMYSAAYWLGSSAGEVYASKAAGVGSIGVIATHMERSEMLKEYGIGVTVVRAGKYKALANGVEKLSEEGKAQIQAGVDSAYRIFVDHVAEMRGKSYEFADSVMAQGREFYGQAAADAGLVDGIKSVDEVLSTIQEKLMDTSKSFMDNRGGQAKGLRVETQGDATMAKKTLTEQEIAALAAGAQLGASVSPAAPQADGGEVPAPQAKKDEAQAGEVPAPEANKEDVNSMSAIKVLSDQLKAAQDELMSARLAHAKLEDKHSELLAVVGPLKDIAVSAMNNMRVALNASALDMAASTPAQVVAEYASVKANFVKQFPVGGVAAVDAVETTEKKADIDPYYRDRVAAVR
jgi:signal peptide peptidase SppA